MVDTSAPVAPAPAETQRPLARAGNLLERSGVPILLGVVLVFFMVHPTTSVNFRSTANVQNILANQSVTALIALAMVIPLVAGYFDLSVAAIAGLANVTVAGMLVNHGQGIFVSLVAGVLIALVAGVVNAVLVAVVRLNAFITTLGTYILISGLLVLYTNGETISAGIPPALGDWGAGQWLGIARPFWLILVIAAIVWYLLMQTPYGRQLAAIGSNESAARLAGIRVDRTVFLAFVLASLFAGLGGALLTVRNAGGDATTGISYLFPALAAVFLGQTAINPGMYNVWGTMFGVFLVAVAVNGLTLMGAAGWVSQVFNGAALLLSVTMSTLLARRRDRRAREMQLEALRAR